MKALRERIKYNYKIVLRRTKAKVRIHMLKEDEFIKAKDKKQLINLLNQIKWMPIFGNDGRVEYVHTYNQCVTRKIKSDIRKLNENYKEK